MPLEPALSANGIMRLASFLSLALWLANAVAAGPGERLAGMAGTWDVQQRMWQGPEADPVELPSAIAQRRLVQQAYLEEDMMHVPGAADPFNRRAVLNFNPVTSRYEYISIDTRAPQLMVELSVPQDDEASASGIRLQGGSFLAPEWGTAKNVRFNYRLTIGAIEGNRQIVRLYFTPENGMPTNEFVAFEYVYVRKP